jgi:hypothetical protein
MNAKEFQTVVEQLNSTTEIIIQLTKELSEEQLKRKPSENEFSVLEQVWHLRDIEVEGYSVRIKKLLTEDRPTLQDINGAKLAVERGYNNLNLEPGLEQFIQARKENVGLLQGLTPEDLSRSGTFENAEEITLERVILMMREHDAEHLNELRELVRG